MGEGTLQFTFSSSLDIATAPAPSSMCAAVSDSALSTGDLTCYKGRMRILPLQHKRSGCLKNNAPFLSSPPQYKRGCVSCHLVVCIPWNTAFRHRGWCRAESSLLPKALWKWQLEGVLPARGFQVSLPQVCHGKCSSGVYPPLGLFSLGSSREVAGRLPVKSHFSASVSCLSTWDSDIFPNVRPKGCYLLSRFSCICRRVASAFCALGLR